MARDQGDVEVVFEQRLGWRVVEYWQAVDEDTEITRSSRTERIRIRGVQFRHPEPWDDASIESHHEASVSRFRARSQHDAVEEVGVAVKREMRPGSHRADSDDGLAAVDQTVHEEGGFFQRIRTVGVHGTNDVAVFGAECIVGKTSHVHDQDIVRTGGAIVLGCPVGNGKLGVVQ